MGFNIEIILKVGLWVRMKSERAYKNTYKPENSMIGDYWIVRSISPNILWIAMSRHHPLNTKHLNQGKQYCSLLRCRCRRTHG